MIINQSIIKLLDQFYMLLVQRIKSIPNEILIRWKNMIKIQLKNQDMKYFT